MERRERRGDLGRVANIAVLERELGKVEYALHKAADPGEQEALRQRKEGLLVLLDQENAKRGG